MKLNHNSLDIFLNGTDITNSVKIFGEEFPIALTAVGSLDIGYKKPINQIFVEIKTPNSITSVITIQKWNGSSWTNINSLDETNGLKKSGFIFFDEDDKPTKGTQNNKEQFWLRLKVSANTANLVLNGINIIFSNLADLKVEEPAIESFYPRGMTSHILSLVAARDYILRRINNAQPMNYYNVPLNALTGQQFVDIRNLNAMDIFSVDELRDSSTYYALYKIYFNRSDSSNDDNYRQKAQDYLEKFEHTFKLFTGRKLSIDLLNDGVEDNTDKINSIRTIRLVR